MRSASVAAFTAPAYDPIMRMAKDPDLCRIRSCRAGIRFVAQYTGRTMRIGTGIAQRACVPGGMGGSGFGVILRASARSGARFPAIVLLSAPFPTPA